ncbi:hypothetical protein ABDK00_014630 [Niabella insulamsoli]|uniref:hypothetical protein n=1 Tax=Niabella insulamsoli TaxID=3144874 RepID=UPI0031FBC26C
MSSKFVLIYFLLAMMMASCGSGTKAIVTPRHDFALKLKEQARFENLSITLKEVAESRCPLNANCVRAGEAVAVLNVVAGGTSERNIQLCTGPDCSRRGLSETYPLSVNDHKYLFKLDSITPDPTKTVERAETRVYFSITAQ